MIVMGTGTTYEQKKDNKSSARRFYECKKCYYKIYIKEPNFQECLYNTSVKVEVHNK